MVQEVQVIDVAPLVGSGPADALVPVAIATDRCKACELCVTICPHHCLALEASVVNALGYHPVHLVDVAACTSCVLCARICPDAVFTVFAPPRTPRP